MARIENNWAQIELAERTITLLSLIVVLRQLKNILVHKEWFFNAKRQKLRQRKRRLLDKESTMTNSGNDSFILADDSSIMRWQKNKKDRYWISIYPSFRD